MTLTLKRGDDDPHEVKLHAQTWLRKQTKAFGAAEEPASVPKSCVSTRTLAATDHAKAVGYMRVASFQNSDNGEGAPCVGIADVVKQAIRG